MPLKPLPIYPVPSYPTRAEAAARMPDLLRVHLPPGWRRDAPLLAFFLSLSAAACASGPQPPPAENPSDEVHVATPLEPEEQAEPGPEPSEAPAHAVVAPIFEHGEGRGAIGCVVVSPPVFLSEEEALTVIREELARHGVHLAESKVVVEGVATAKQRQVWGEDANGDIKIDLVEVPGSSKPLRIDGVDRKRHVAVEFVSAEREYFELGGPESQASVQDFDTKRVAATLAETIQSQARDPFYVGVLYDPIVTDSSREGGPAEWKAREARLREEARALLKAQVSDFVAWLAEQGIH